MLRVEHITGHNGQNQQTKLKPHFKEMSDLIHSIPYRIPNLVAINIKVFLLDCWVSIGSQKRTKSSSKSRAISKLFVIIQRIILCNPIGLKLSVIKII